MAVLQCAGGVAAIICVPGHDYGCNCRAVFRRHADGLAQRGVRVDGLADVHGVGAHFDGQGDLADHVARMGADDAAAQDLAVAVALGAVVEQQLGEAFVAPVGDGAARGRQGNRPF